MRHEGYSTVSPNPALCERRAGGIKEARRSSAQAEPTQEAGLSPQDEPARSWPGAGARGRA
jgi:hypothetical protein